MEGFTRGRELRRWAARCRTPPSCPSSTCASLLANVLGEQGEAFGYLGHNLPQERLTVAVGSVSQARFRESPRRSNTPRTARSFGTPVASFQNTKFELASCSTEVEAAQGDAGPRGRPARRRRAVCGPTRPG